MSNWNDPVHLRRGKYLREHIDTCGLTDFQSEDFDLYTEVVRVDERNRILTELKERTDFKAYSPSDIGYKQGLNLAALIVGFPPRVGAL